MIEQLVTWIKDVFKHSKYKHTLMIIPHNENGIKNIHLSNLKIAISLFSFVSFTLIASFFIIRHTIHSKELDRLKRFRTINQTNLKIYKNELYAFNEYLDVFREDMQKFNQFSKSDNNQLFGIGGNDIDIDNLSENLKSFLAQKKQLSDEPIGLWKDNTEYMQYTYKIIRNVNNFIQKRSEFMSSLPSLWPIEGGIGTPIKNSQSAKRLLIKCIGSLPVLSAGKGIVTHSEKSKDGLFSIKIDHGYGLFSEYNQLVGIKVETGAEVKKGSTIGISSKELDFRVKIASTYVDPSKFAVARFN